MYPWNYLACIAMILSIQLFDFFLYSRDYLVDLHTMPPMSFNKLRYNKALFKK